jgi:hypothetical protein
MSVACAVTANDSAAAAASPRLTLKKFMNQILLICGILPGAAPGPSRVPTGQQSIAHRRSALHDRNVTV